MVKEGKILTSVDLTEFVREIHANQFRKRMIAVALGTVVWTVLVGGKAFLDGRLTQRYRVALADVAGRLKSETARADKAERDLANLKTAMSMSMDVSKFKRPVRLSGELIVMFGGEVK